MEHNDSGLPRILIIDDMVINQMLLSSQLQALKIESDVASSGEQGLALYRSNHYDLVLLDQHMPDMDGIDTLAGLKAIFTEQGRAVPVICETADDSSDVAEKLKEAGFAEILIKPIDFGELYDMMVRQLGDSFSAAQPADEATEEELERALAGLPDWLHEIKGLDIRYGLQRCGGNPSDYMDALAIFVASIDDKTRSVQHYLEADNEQLHILRLHSLKSSSRLIGAVTLAEQAAALETAGKVGNTSALKSGTETLIAHYRELEDQLRPHLSSAHGSSAILPPVSEETLHDIYTALDASIKSHDMDNIDTLLGSLGEYALDSEDAVRLERMRIARRKKDDASFAAILSEIL